MVAYDFDQKYLLEVSGTGEMVLFQVCNKKTVVFGHFCRVECNE
jgi:hypothetical protein